MRRKHPCSMSFIHESPLIQYVLQEPSLSVAECNDMSTRTIRMMSTQAWESVDECEYMAKLNGHNHRSRAMLPFIHCSLPPRCRARCSLQKCTVISRLVMYPKRAWGIPHLNGYDPILENIVRFHSYSRFKPLHMGGYILSTRLSPSLS